MFDSLNFRHGILVYFFTLLLMTTLGSTVQYLFGIYGLIATELMLLASALGFASFFKAEMAEVFPLRLPQISEFFSSLLVFAGGYIAELGAIYIIQHLFPQSTDFAETMTSLSGTVPPLVGLTAIAVLPAVCEEALHRGLLLRCICGGISKGGSPLSSPRMLICAALSGITFGLFHLDLYRILPTAILGSALAIISLATESLILNVFFHFITNLISLLAMYSLSDRFSFGIPEIGIFTSPLLRGIVYLAVGSALITLGAFLLLRLYHKRRK